MQEHMNGSMKMRKIMFPISNNLNAQKTFEPTHLYLGAFLLVRYSIVMATLLLLLLWLQQFCREISNAIFQ